MSEVVAIILAAGQSRRMGARNKLLLSIGGVPMIRHMADLYQTVTQRPVLVVTGHQADAVKMALKGSGARPVHNPDHSQGQHTSVACGLRAVDGDGAILLGLGDQPVLMSADLNALIAAHRDGEPDKISIPCWDGRRGNPIVVPGALRARLLTDPKTPGCKRFTRAHPEHVQFHALPDRGFYTDVDTPHAYAALANPTPEMIQ